MDGDGGDSEYGDGLSDCGHNDSDLRGGMGVTVLMTVNVMVVLSVVAVVLVVMVSGGDGNDTFGGGDFGNGVNSDNGDEMSLVIIHLFLWGLVLRYFPNDAFIPCTLDRIQGKDKKTFDRLKQFPSFSCEQRSAHSP